MSSGVVKTLKLARAVAVRSSRSWSGIVQWWPARTQIANRSRTWATSWGWIPGRLNGMTPPRRSGSIGPYSSMSGTARGSASRA